MGSTPSAPEKLGIWAEAGPEDAKLGVSPILHHHTINVKEPIPTVMPDGARTVWEAAERSFHAFGDKNAMGKREIEKKEMVPSPDGKKQFEKLTLSSEYHWLTYEQFGARVERLASGFVSRMGLKKGDRVLIFAETQLDWTACMLACFRQGVTIVTAYATLGQEGVTTSLNQTGATLVVCDAKLFPVVEKSAKECPSLKFVVPIMTKIDEKTPEQMEKGLPNGIRVFSTDQIVDAYNHVDDESDAGSPTSLGSASPTSTSGKPDIVDADPPEPEDLAVIMYTSGTTGASKGVMIKHINICAQGASTLKIMPFIDASTVYIAYLPLAHIMELFIEVGMMSQGAAIGFGTPQTLTNTGVKLAAGQEGDAPLLKPTLMVFAPAVLDKVYGGVKDKVAKKGGMAESLFNTALQAGYSNYDAGGVGCGMAWDLLMYNSVQSLVGGKVTQIVAGSAPLSAEIQKFAQSCFNCPVRQGYGLTETCAASCVADPGDNTLEQVGPPTPGTYVRLRDWPEGNYTNADKDKPEIGMRRGEVLLGGPTVTAGYLIDPKNPDLEIKKKNEEDFTEIEGVRYFCTGDVGQINARGCLQIIDRKKDLFKGDTGEYVSLSKVEALLKLSSFVEVPMVYGRTGAKTVIALICPKKFAIEGCAKEKGIEGTFEELCKHPDIVAEVSKSCLKECKGGGLLGFEMPSAIALCATPDGTPAWTPENDLLTTTMKLKRPIIAKAFDAQITDAYARS